MVWAVCLVVLGLCCGGRVFVFCFDGVGGWVSTGSPCGVELPRVDGVGAVVSFGASRGLVGWKAGV